MRKRTSCAACAVALLATGLAPAGAQAPAPQAERAARAEALRFDILAFNVLGNTVLSVDEIETVVYPFLGPGKGIADAEAARAALERAYQSRGFLSVVVTLPPQSITHAELTLEVVEARIDQRKITGSRYHLPSTIADKTPSLAPGSVPNFEDMQAELARAQASVDVQITPVITPGDDPRKLGVELKVQDKLPLHGSIELNSKQSYNTERGRLEAAVHYDNLFQRGHSIGLNWVYAPTAPGQANTWVLTYAAPWARDGSAGDDRLSATLVHSGSETPASIGGATVVRGDTLGLRWRTPLRSRDPMFSHGFAAGVDIKNNRDSSRSVTGGNTSNAALRYAAFSFGYDLFVSSPDGARTGFDAGLVFGLPAFGSHDVDCNGRILDQFECKRAGASARFMALRLNATHQRPIFGRWELSLQAQAQLAPDPLVSGEQFGAGGLSSVRGYFDYEQVGDQGLALRAELASPPWLKTGSLSLHGIGFVEGAALRLHEALPGERSSIGMASAGLGLRLQGSAGLQARLDFALPLRETLKADSSGSLVPASGKASRNERRWDLTVRYLF